MTRACNMLLLALLLALTHTPATRGAHYFNLADNNVTEAQISGQFVCSVTGAPVPGDVPSPGLAGADVNFVCNGTQISQTTTNATGHFFMALNITDIPLFEPRICFARVDLPVTNCTLFPAEGVLQAAVSVVDIVASAAGVIALLVAELLGICVNGYCTFNQ